MFDLASGVLQGDRKLQQDSVGTYLHEPSGLALLSLSDGVGGAGFGHLASRLIQRSALARLKARLSEMVTGHETVPDILHDAALTANRALARVIADQPDKAGMGGTLLLAVLAPNRVYHLSIGDSLIWRLHAGELVRLNADHSLASGLDSLAKMGKIDAAAANAMAARSTLTSALVGQRLSKVDVPVDGVAMERGDCLLLASDGIETLGVETIRQVLMTAHGIGAARTVAALISNIEELDARGQDNVSATVVVL